MMGRARTELPQVDEAAIARMTQRIVEAFHPIRVVLFGSQARGDTGRDSDIDLFIEMQSSESPRARRLAVRELLDDEGYPLDVVVLTPAEAAQARSQSGSILSYIDAEGRVLYERG